MVTNFQHETATIYQFPRKAPTTAMQRQQARLVAESRDAQICAVEFGSGWYHEAALQHVEPARKS